MRVPAAASTTAVQTADSAAFLQSPLPGWSWLAGLLAGWAQMEAIMGMSGEMKRGELAAAVSPDSEQTLLLYSFEVRHPPIK